jgi:YVTN family beta-propeller protein
MSMHKPLKSITQQRRIVGEGTQITVGSGHHAIGVDEITNKIYVTNSQSGTVSVIDSNTGTVKNIRVGASPGYIAVDSNHNKIYVANQDSNTVSVIDGNNDTQTKQISVGETPRYILIFEGKIYVANLNSNTVSVIYASNDTKGHDIAVGSGPIYMALGGEQLTIVNKKEPVSYTFIDHGRKIYVANSYDNTVSVIYASNDMKGHDIAVGNGPRYIAVDPFHYKIYVANSYDNTVSVISQSNDTKKGHDIAVGIYPTHIVFDYDANKTYVANIFNNTVSVIDINTDDEIRQISTMHNIQEGHPVGTDFPNYIAEGYSKPFFIFPLEIPYAGIDTKIYVANTLNNTVSVINPSNDTKKGHDIAVGIYPTHIAVNTLTDMVYVANDDSNTVSVIDGSSDKVAAGVIFNVDPPNSGRIVCDNAVYPTNIYLYVDAGTSCTAQPNKDLSEFNTWVEHPLTNRNSTIPLDSTGNLTVNRYGMFTVNFIQPRPLSVDDLFKYLTGGLGTAVAIIGAILTVPRF